MFLYLSRMPDKFCPYGEKEITMWAVELGHVGWLHVCQQSDEDVSDAVRDRPKILIFLPGRDSEAIKESRNRGINLTDTIKFLWSNFMTEYSVHFTEYCLSAGTVSLINSWKFGWVGAFRIGSVKDRKSESSIVEMPPRNWRWWDGILILILISILILILIIIIIIIIWTISSVNSKFKGDEHFLDNLWPGWNRFVNQPQDHFWSQIDIHWWPGCSQKVRSYMLFISGMDRENCLFHMKWNQKYIWSLGSMYYV
jgi:hypothetical protein